MTMKWLNVNAAGNPDLVACFKQECRTVLCLVWHTIKNHITTTSYRALLVHKQDFVYKCAETGYLIYEGFTLLRMIYMVVKPDLVINVKDFQLKMEKMTLLTTEVTLTTSLEELKQEINPPSNYLLMTPFGCRPPIPILPQSLVSHLIMH
jgi:hypothetical protein